MSLSPSASQPAPHLTCPVFSLLIRSLGVLVGTLWEGTVTGGSQGSGGVQGGPWGVSHLLMREAKGCTCSEVPMMSSRSTFSKSC